MKYIILFFISTLFFSCNSKQREYENSLLFPEKEKYGFDVTYNMQYLSDVKILFNFSCNPSEKTVAAIESELTKFEEQHQKKFAHETTKIDDRYTLSVTFKRLNYDIYSEFDMKKDVDAFEALLKSIDSNSDIQDLTGVHFE